MAEARKPKTARTALSGSVTLAKKVRGANRWREQYNPLRGLTMSRAAAMLDGFYRGEMAELQWTCFSIEGSDPDMIALIDRRLSAIEGMDWQTKPGLRRRRDGVEIDETLAAEQDAALYEFFDRIENLDELIAHLALTTFRGFAHAEKIDAGDGMIERFALVDPWNVVRDGLRGAWKLNPNADATTYDALSNDWLIDPEQFITRTHDRWINRIALTKLIRQSLSQKDWDAFIEIYGIPGGVIIGPPNVPENKEGEYQQAAQDVAEGGSGYLPNGADYKPNDAPRGNNPFKEHLDYLTEKLILAGTGGKLTMLASPTGLGQGASGEHADVFESIARAEARRISGLLQRQLAAPYLAEKFPGKPQLAYFEIAANEETDAGDVVEHVSKLGTAGYEVDPAQIEEKTGYRVEIKQTVAPEPFNDPAGDLLDDPSGDPGNDAPLRNRAPAADPATRELLTRAQQLVGKANAEDLQPLRNALETLLDGPDETFANRLTTFRETLSRLTGETLMAPATTAAFQELLADALLGGLLNKEDQP